MPRQIIPISDYKAERRQAAGTWVDLENGTQVCFIPALLYPPNIDEVVASRDYRALLAVALGGDDQVDLWLAAGLNVKMGIDFLERVHIGGLALGESAASSTTSAGDGTSSRPTSSASTVSTSSTPALTTSASDGSGTSSVASPESRPPTKRTTRKKPRGGSPSSS